MTTTQTGRIVKENENETIEFYPCKKLDFSFSMTRGSIDVE
jgi:hypothetical protein